MPDNEELLQRITARPDVFGGKPIIRDMRLSVELVLSLLSQGVTVEALLDDYPELDLDDIRACIAYAHAVIAIIRGTRSPRSPSPREVLGRSKRRTTIRGVARRSRP